MVDVLVMNCKLDLSDFLIASLEQLTVLIRLNRVPIDLIQVVIIGGKLAERRRRVELIHLPMFLQKQVLAFHHVVVIF